VLFFNNLEGVDSVSEDYGNSRGLSIENVKLKIIGISGIQIFIMDYSVSCISPASFEPDEFARFTVH
jgi:hypothetical protein